MKISVHGMRKIALLLYVCFLILSLSACNMTPPTVDETEEFFMVYREDILAVTEFMLSSECESIHIDKNDDEVFVDFSYVSLETLPIEQSVRRLFDAGCRRISKSGSFNIIEFFMWARTYNEAYGGFYYVVDPSKEASAQYQTQVAPLSENGWYYYLAEYNLWRVEATRETAAP